MPQRVGTSEHDIRIQISCIGVKEKLLVIEALDVAIRESKVRADDLEYFTIATKKEQEGLPRPTRDVEVWEGMLARQKEKLEDLEHLRNALITVAWCKPILESEKAMVSLRRGFSSYQ
jgi:hypothetical protein